jgi:pullulanase/glycogen debranching enzyme
MARRLIVDSVVHWLTEYHVDGFRFDLAAMLDDETLRAVRDAAQRRPPRCRSHRRALGWRAI